MSTELRDDDREAILGSLDKDWWWWWS
ncbi:unnamed protein product, partial [Vitis vinifera]